MQKHTKICVFSGTISLALLIISVFIPKGSFLANMASALQGIAAGIISGIVLLFVSGIKTSEIRNINARIKKLENLIQITGDLSDLLSESYEYIFNFGTIKPMIYQKINDNSHKLEELLRDAEFHNILGNRFNDILQFLDDLSENVSKYYEYVQETYSLDDTDIACLWEMSRKSLDSYSCALKTMDNIQSKLRAIENSPI